MQKTFFDVYSNTNNITRERVINSASPYARQHFLYVQEVGYLKGCHTQSNIRKNLNSYLFFIVLSGHGYIIYQDETYDLHENSCVLIDCNHEYSHWNNHDSPWEILWIHFNGCSAHDYYTYFKTSCQNVFEVSSSKQLIYTINELITIHKNKDITTELLASKYITDLITYSIISQTENHRNNNVPIIHKLSSVKDYLDSHYQEKITLDNLEEKFYISKYHLLREFKKNFGCTITTYLHDKRITKAKELLRYTDLTIETIAHNCGISDPNYFNRVFQKHEGMTASKYRSLW